MEIAAVHNLSVRSTEKTVPVYLYVIVLASLSIIIGLVWDISWHMSIGRDGLFSAPHLAIYLGGVTAGIFAGYRILKVSFAGTAEERASQVKFWGIFYSSLGNMFCVWGAIAMLTSAPFDDWWHNTYGLDVTILSPPHTVLLLGMIMIQFGAIVSVLAYQNNTFHDTDESTARQFNLLFALSGGFVLTMIFTIASEYLGRHEMHGALFYQVSSLLFPLFLVAFSTAARTRWGATQATIVYSVFLILINWILPLFPAVPKLGPVLNPVTTFQPFDFPLLLIFPALAIDWFTFRYSQKHSWIKALGYGALFLFCFAIVQWPFANLLMASRGHWLLGTSRWYFGSDPSWQYRYEFAPWMITQGLDLLKGLAIALAIAILSSRVGLSWGKWMKRVSR